jgi:carbonic anhydrase
VKKLISGIHRFRERYWGEYREVFEHLAAHGQNPDALFITCCDSRIDPNLLTRARPGDLFVVRNVGNFVPPYREGSPDVTGVGAAIEYAVDFLRVRDIVICGHTDCGSIRALYDRERYESGGTPHIAEWLKLGDRTVELVAKAYPGLSHEEREGVAFEENVLIQLENLCTYPVVRRAIDEGRLHAHAWFFHIATGTVYHYDPLREEYVPIRYEDGRP